MRIMFYKYLIKKGKKSKAKKIVTESFYEVSKKLKIPLTRMLRKVYRPLSVYAEPRNVSVRRGRYVVPFPVKKKRRFYLASRWILLSVKNNKERKSFSYKLAKELELILDKKKKRHSVAHKLKRENNSKVLQNRSNLHYRW